MYCSIAEVPSQCGENVHVCQILMLFLVTPLLMVKELKGVAQFSFLTNTFCLLSLMFIFGMQIKQLNYVGSDPDR